MTPGKSVAFHTLGCKLNYSETSAIADTLKTKGYLVTEFENEADVYVINTCSVTENADKECRYLVRGILSRSPLSFIAVIGCYAQLKPKEIAAIEGIDLVLGAADKFKLADYLDVLHHSEGLRKRNSAEIHSCEVEDVDVFVPAWSLSDRTRSFLKIQDGCDYTCSYCTIPLARGKSRSGSIEQVVADAVKLAAGGVKEIVLTGVNIGDFGIHHNQAHLSQNQAHLSQENGPFSREENFLGLIKKLDTTSVERFRISSIEPNLLKDEIINFVASSSRFVPHFHIPLQSGSDKILKLMRRRYLRSTYAERVMQIKAQIPSCCIGVDVIVGFPGETEEDFLETYSFLNELAISYLHVFTYSERDHTEASTFEESVSVAERKKRNKMLRILSAKKLRQFYQENAGSDQIVLFEKQSKDGFMYGWTGNYIKVKTIFDEQLVNRLVPVKLGTTDPDGTMNVELIELPHYVS